MKKAIKNYLTQLRENEEKGFSLVELIIVMAIMAILVGIVASQVLPYMEKSRQSKDQQQLSSIGTDLVSAIAQSEEDVATIGATDIKNVKSGATGELAKFGKTFEDLRGGAITADGVNDKLKSKAAKGKQVLFKYDASTGVITVYVAGHPTPGNGEKLCIETE